MAKTNFDTNFKNVLKLNKLSEKQYKFFENLVNPQSETQGDIVSSFHGAGYEENPTSKYYAYKVYNSTKFQNVLTAYREKELKKEKNREFTMLERTSEDLNFIIDKSKKTGDLTTMRQAVMDRAKLHGLLIDRHQVIDPIAEQEINKTKQIEAAQVAEQRLLGEPVEPMDEVIDADFEPVQVEECPAELSTNDIESAILGREAG